MTEVSAKHFIIEIVFKKTADARVGEAISASQTVMATGLPRVGDLVGSDYLVDGLKFNVPMRVHGVAWLLRPENSTSLDLPILTVHQISGKPGDVDLVPVADDLQQALVKADWIIRKHSVLAVHANEG